MSDFESQGSFIYEPTISERELAQRLHDLSSLMTPDKCKEIERQFSLALATPFENQNLYRAKQELSAALEHEVGDELTVKFHLNPTWKTLEPSHLEVSLPGTEAIKAQALYNSDQWHFDAYLKDASGKEFPRHPISISAVESLLASLGVTNQIEFSQEGLQEWLRYGASKETHQHIVQRHVIYESKSDDEVTGTCAIEKEQITSPDEITTYTRFVETILTDEKRFARILTLFESDLGSGLLVEEVSQNEDGNESQRTQRALDYELIEKLLRHLRNAELLATRSE